MEVKKKDCIQIVVDLNLERKFPSGVNRLGLGRLSIDNPLLGR